MAIARPIDKRLLFAFDRAHAQISKAADKFLVQSSGLSFSQAAALIYLGFHDGCHLSDLAKGIGRNNPAVTGLVSRMEKADLVKRGHGGHDGRTKSVFLTDLGWEKRQLVMEGQRIFNEKLSRGMTETDINAIFKFLSLGPENVTPEP